MMKLLILTAGFGEGHNAAARNLAAASESLVGPESSKLAQDHRCAGVLCGHIHTPADKMIGGVHYLTSGDWIESLPAIVEHCDGRFELIAYADFLRDHPMPDEEPALDTAEAVEA